MKNVLLLCVIGLLGASCATGMGKKMSQQTIDEIQAGKGKLTRDEVRKKIGAAPQTQMARDGMECDSYAYTGVVNYFLFTVQDKSQSYAFCYKNGVLVTADGIQM